MPKGRNHKRAKTDSCEGSLEEYAWTDGIKEAPAFSPTVEEFEDPIRYIETIAPEASKFGRTRCSHSNRWQTGQCQRSLAVQATSRTE
mmetsp:Transcript_4660/g.12230  ORF Transcript_4660/g.12230 Transcript_4660/m.12230 type:complete len:88 (+) Transcript_4660:134-397(+)